MDASEIFGVVTDATDTGISIGSLIAKIIPTQRKCRIELTNHSSKYILCNPRVHIKSGRNSIPLPPSIQPTTTGEALFNKVPNTAGGAAGIFTYDLLDISTKTSSKKMAVLFKVPFNLKQLLNTYAVGVLDISKECNQELFQEMYKSSNATFVRGPAKVNPSLTHAGQNVTIAATMSNFHESVIKVELSDS